MKYTPDGGVISVIVELAGNELSFEIRDSGIGIEKSKMTSIFDLYTWLDRSETNRKRRLGLSLALVRRLAKPHGGRVEVPREGTGDGSEFTVRFPTLPSSLRNDEKKYVGARLNESLFSRILLVEDDEDVAEVMGEVIGMGGHTVSVARNGEDALKQQRTFKPNVILLDIGLPDIDGYEVARRMRKESDQPDVAIIALSGYGDESHRRQSIQAGCDEHLVKPIDIHVLLNALAPRACIE